MSNQSTIDTSQLDDFFDRLNQNNRNKVMWNAIREIGEDLQSETVERVIQKMGNAAKSTQHKNGKKHKSMVKGVKIIKEEQFNTVVVSIMGQASLKLFELGTDERYTKRDKVSPSGRLYKKGQYRGKIEPKGFFKEARISVSEGDLIKKLEEGFNELVN